MTWIGYGFDIVSLVTPIKIGLALTVFQFLCAQTGWNTKDIIQGLCGIGLDAVTAVKVEAVALAGFSKGGKKLLSWWFELTNFGIQKLIGAAEK